MRSKIKIGEYNCVEACVVPYDIDYPVVAGLVATAVYERNCRCGIEHVGSTAVPGCDGKGIIDLALLYEDGGLEESKQMLADMGFQQQPHRDPFPESRPMRVGSLEFHNKVFQLHVHVIEQSSKEEVELIRFRDMLRADTTLKQDYINAKVQILDDGVIDSSEYCIEKSRFVEKILGR
ncbi:MAG: GrpB family protein [Planctomycetes bacterium]|nr:GrpB family protein [Planctomycetota bacterium]